MMTAYIAIEQQSNDSTQVVHLEQPLEETEFRKPIFNLDDWNNYELKS